MRIELLTATGCPNAAPARALVADCLRSVGMEVQIVERTGRYASPTVLVNGVDVMRPHADVPAGDACRLDLPTRDRVLAALSGTPEPKPQQPCPGGIGAVRRSGNGSAC